LLGEGKRTGRRNSASSKDSLSGTVSLDGSVLIELLSSTDLSKPLRDAIEGDAVNPYTTFQSLIEAEYILCREKGWEKAREKIDVLTESRAVELVEASELVHETARIKCARAIALTDCYTIALAEKLNGTAVFAHLEDDLSREMKRKPFSTKLAFLEPTR
jgi:predicted nucleic acid-binding protein